MNTSTTGSGERATAASESHPRSEVVRAAPAGVQQPPPAVRTPAAPRDTLSDDVRSSLLLIASTAAFALAVVALGTLVSGVPG